MHVENLDGICFVNKITKKSIEQKLDNTILENGLSIVVFDQLESTNQWVLDHVLEFESKKVMCVADTQVSGRGRCGRVWQSPAGGNVYMSFTHILDVKQKSFSAISLVIGLALVRVLKAAGVQGVSLKWPNDVLLDGKKVAGVLLETKFIDNKIVLVVGVGLNVEMPVDSVMPEDIDWKDLSLSDLTAKDRGFLIAKIYGECEKLIKSFVKNGFTVFQQEWTECDAFFGRGVKVMDQGVVTASGIESGVDEGGCLLLRTEKGINKISSGDVSLRININED